MNNIPLSSLSEYDVIINTKEYDVIINTKDMFLTIPIITKPKYDGFIDARNIIIIDNINKNKKHKHKV